MQIVPLGAVTSSNMAEFFLFFVLFFFYFSTIILLIFFPENLTFYSENTPFNSLACKIWFNISLCFFKTTSGPGKESESLQYFN